MVKLSEKDKLIIDLELEKSRLNREKSVLVLNKALFLYFCFLFVGVIGFVNNYITAAYLLPYALYRFRLSQIRTY